MERGKKPSTDVSEGWNTELAFSHKFGMVVSISVMKGK